MCLGRPMALFHLMWISALTVVDERCANVTGLLRAVHYLAVSGEWPYFYCVCLLVSLTLSLPSIHTQILTLEKPEPKVILKPPPQPQPLQNPPTTSPTPSPSPLPSSYATPTAAALDSSTNGTGDYVRDRHGSFLAADGRRTVPSTPAHIRRFDSQSLLSENSIASSRFDLTEGAPYPE